MIPLQQGHIRLFNSELDDNDDIRGTLEGFEHKSAPQFIAQSYVCGEGECDNRITVNGNAHNIKPNLAIALHQTKSALFEMSVQPSLASNAWVWVDAICIDQSNVAELEAQIRFMDRIYRAATATFISLGKWSEPQRLLVGFFQWQMADAKISRLQEERRYRSIDIDGTQVLDDARTQPSSHEWPAVLQTDFDMSIEDAKMIRDVLAGGLRDGNSSSRALYYAHPFWQACMELFEAGWFSRLWTLQELWLSPHPFLTLQAIIPWDTLALLPESMWKLNFAPRHPLGTVVDDRFRRFLHHYASLCYLKRSLITDDFWILLQIAATKRAKLPKDHVFAILGLMDADTQRLIDVDYSKTDAQVFQDTIQAAMRRKLAAWRLPGLWEAFALIPTTTPGLPSWVPDLNNDTNADIFGHWCGLLLSEAIWSASVDAAQLRVSPEDGLIFLNVLEVDVVSLPGGEPLISHETTQDEPVGLMMWIKGLYNTMTSGEDDLSALKERLGNFFATIAELRKDQIVALVFLMAVSQLLTEELTLGKVFLHIRHELHPTHELYQEILEKLNAETDEPLIESLHLVARLIRSQFPLISSTYIFTTSGGRVGCSPKPVSARDRICLVPGGEYLHIFSTTPSRYVTCASVHGLMGDDLSDLVRERGREWEEIAIH